MNRTRVVAALLRLYPRAWRKEYGPELAEMLSTGPLHLRDAADVLWNGLRERARATQPGVYCGLIGMVCIAWDWPVVHVTPWKLIPLWIICGAWTEVRYRPQPRLILRSYPGSATAALLAGLPTMLLGTLVLIGAMPGPAVIWAAKLPIPVVLVPLGWPMHSGAWVQLGGWLARKLVRQPTDR